MSYLRNGSKGGFEPGSTRLRVRHSTAELPRSTQYHTVPVRHKPQWQRHDRRGSAVVPTLIAVAPRKTVKTADLLPPSHRRRGATAVLVRHKPQWHRHDRRGSAMVPSLMAVAPRKTVTTADLRGGTADTLNMFKTSAVPPRVMPIRSGIAAAASLPPWTVQGSQ